MMTLPFLYKWAHTDDGVPETDWQKGYEAARSWVREVGMPPVDDVVKAWQQSNALVMAMVGEALVSKWWNSPNKSFDMQTPMEMWSDDYKKVHNYLMHHAFIGGGS